MEPNQFDLFVWIFSLIHQTETHKAPVFKSDVSRHHFTDKHCICFSNWSFASRCRKQMQRNWCLQMFFFVVFFTRLILHHVGIQDRFLKELYALFTLRQNRYSLKSRVKRHSGFTNCSNAILSVTDLLVALWHFFTL